MSGMANAVGLLAVAVVLLVGALPSRPQKQPTPRVHETITVTCMSANVRPPLPRRHKVFDNCMKARGYKEK